MRQATIAILLLIVAGHLLAQAPAATGAPPETAAQPSTDTTTRAPAACGSQYIHVEHDRFTGGTKAVAMFSPSATQSSAGIGAVTGIPGKPDEIGVALFSLSNRGLRYNACHAAYILADDKPVPTMATTYQAKVVQPARPGKTTTQGGSGAVSVPVPIPRLGWLGLTLGGGKTTTTTEPTAPVTQETVIMRISPEALAQLGAAQRIEFKVCNDEVVATEAFVQAAHEVACVVGGR